MARNKRAQRHLKKSIAPLPREGVSTKKDGLFLQVRCPADAAAYVDTRYPFLLHLKKARPRCLLVWHDTSSLTAAPPRKWRCHQHISEPALLSIARSYYIVPLA